MTAHTIKTEIIMRHLPPGITQNRNGTFSVKTEKLTGAQREAIKCKTGKVPEIVVVQLDKIENIVRPK